MYRHLFWCVVGKISIAAAALLAQCTTYQCCQMLVKKTAQCPHKRSLKPAQITPN